MSIESVAAQSGVFATQIAKGTQGGSSEAFSKILRETDEQKNYKIAAAKITQRSAEANQSLSVIRPAPELSPANTQYSDTRTKAGYRRINNILEQMIHKANQSTNQMSDAGRARISEEFESLTDQLNKAMEKYGVFDQNVIGIVQGYVENMDISTQADAAEAYTYLHGVEDAIENHFGIETSSGPMPDHMETLAELESLAYQAANQMTPEGRERVNKQYHEKLDTYMKQLESSGLIEYDAVLNFIGQYMSSHDLSTQEGAQFAFNHLNAQQSYISSLLTQA